MACIRVDGNDVLAVYNAVVAARRLCMDEFRPVLVEAMTYRVGHHSTSDDSTAYRSVDEVKYWHQKDHPITRLRKYMEHRSWWDDKRENEWRDACKKQVMDALTHAEKRPKPPIDEMFQDVYDVMPDSLRQQRDSLMQHLDLYKDQYPIKQHDKTQT
jgi:2-oxoisovalerate dehydrogenase E1 component alpha subunit